ncbi:MAG: 5-oxoprolinase subunit PxpB [Firmicutes bacterium]|nr:5-oxoprolinase subunit PxpB [Bacillota bacterium]
MEKALIKIVDCGDSAVSVRFPQEISPKVHSMVMGCFEVIRQAGIPGVLGAAPAYASVLVRFDPLVTDGEAVKDALAVILTEQKIAAPSHGTGRVVEIPVCYGGEYGPDIENVMSHTGLGLDSLVGLHTGNDYPVHMIGFTAGFPYLGGMDERLAAPRLALPREHIAAGSVGIAGGQTGMYSVASPGGWQIIGRTPLRLFDPDREEPFMIKAGDRVRFVSITEEEFIELEAKAYARARRKQEAAKAAPKAKRHAVRESVTVTSPGPFTTVQDAGRHGHVASGLSGCGPMDPYALDLGNELLGNAPNAAGLEATLRTPGLKFSSDTYLCITGGYCEPRLKGSGKTLQMNEVIPVKAGSELLPAPVKLGCRTYFTFAGGIDVPEVLGSRSTDSRAMIGGVSGGRKLEEGDVLPLGSAESWPVKLVDTSHRNLSQLGAAVKILFITKGPQFEDLSEEAVRTFTTDEYTVSTSSDRMGTRFDGPALTFAGKADGNIITDGVLPGAIQVVPSGKPILMNADAQVSGGYSKPFWLASVSKSAAAQLRPGDKVRFVLISTGEAVRRYRESR